ncbi:cysteine proteinase [Massarina eburnea CBS 473.64]|uniref:ubiquitinyl hydrolase 1 n=1 Tax=Massarina eburnea CBS 473.64 TaxID=1395130 RepID=A0A6A6RY25_9PLEO|nr:cysteine proteinase [Massarina eburnea CBS 473.64]
MNGVQRFLSRREKHYHEKRLQKHARRTVCPSPSHSSVSSLESHSSQHLLCDGGGGGSSTNSQCDDSDSPRQRRPNCLHQLCCVLPATMRSFVHDGLLLRRKKPPTTALSHRYILVSTGTSSDHLTLQSRNAPSTVPDELYKVFTQEEPKQTDKDKDGEKKVKMLVYRLQASGITGLGEEQAEHALYWCPDDLDAAYDLLVLVNESFEGELKDYDSIVPLQGAVNRDMVTCYLDSLLFAMFARMDSFDAMLYDEISDEPRKQLAGVLRLWVNMLRTGRLIKTELTRHLQDSLAKCGWEEAALICQQDASEAFTFITGALELPLLTLKMDIFHTGRENKEDDHKFVNERLLEVAIPEQEADEAITLEQCLETYFNNRIEVKRHLQRQNTLSSIHTVGHDPEKSQTVYIEEIMDSPVLSPTSVEPLTPVTSGTSSRPVAGRKRGDSIFAERYTNHGKPGFDEKKHLDEIFNNSSGGRPRAGSMRKEVMMPAWQFFSLIPWYTDNMPKTDAQVATHFSTKRPVLGICLKRYTMTLSGEPKRLDTYIDIPLEIGLPHFISDERMAEDSPLFGNFKLVLQSVVCHRGVSVDSGHYISLARANRSPTADRPSTSNSEEEDVSDSWLRYDDIANPRVAEIDIEKALREESPYLLFYQVQPIDEELALRGDPPPYAEAESGPLTADPSKETLVSETEASSTAADTGEWEKVYSTDAEPFVTETTVFEPLGRASMSSVPRTSIEFDSLPRGRSGPATPDEQKSGFLSTSRRNSRNWLGGGGSKYGSRPNSQSGETRLSLTLSRLTGRASKDRLLITEHRDSVDDPIIIINEVDSAQSTENGGQVKSPVKERKENGNTPGRAKSKRDKKEEKKLRSKSLDPITGVAVKGKGKQKTKGRPDRECVVM